MPRKTVKELTVDYLRMTGSVEWDRDGFEYADIYTTIDVYEDISNGMVRDLIANVAEILQNDEICDEHFNALLDLMYNLTEYNLRE